MIQEATRDQASGQLISCYPREGRIKIITCKHEASEREKSATKDNRSLHFLLFLYDSNFSLNFHGFHM